MYVRKDFAQQLGSILQDILFKNANISLNFVAIFLTYGQARVIFNTLKSCDIPRLYRTCTFTTVSNSIGSIDVTAYLLAKSVKTI